MHNTSYEICTQYALLQEIVVHYILLIEGKGGCDISRGRIKTKERSRARKRASSKQLLY